MEMELLQHGQELPVCEVLDDIKVFECIMGIFMQFDEPIVLSQIYDELQNLHKLVQMAQLVVGHRGQL